MRNIFYLLFFVWGITACTSDKTNFHGKPVQLDYATLLQIEETDSFTQVIVKNAWDPEDDLAVYVLVPQKQPLPQQLPEGIIVRTPLQRAAINSSVHAALFLDLQAGAAIAGLADTAYIVSPRVKRLLQQGTRNIGSSMQPDIEQLHAIRADALFVSPFENAGHGALDCLDIPIIECADYMETSPLGRAEWMKFYGRLIGKDELADSLFASVEKAYNALKKKVAKGAGKQPTVMCDLRLGGIWYQPGGASTMGIVIQDAGGDYLWKDRKESGSLPLEFESVYAKAHNADLWLVKNGQRSDLTYEQMALDYPQYKRFRPWKEGNIWVCNTLETPYYEEVPFRPNLLLESLVAIFHPECLARPQVTYYQQLKR